MDRRCNKCGDTDPINFYQSTNRNQCKLCYIKIAIDRNKNLVDLDKKQKAVRVKCARCSLIVTEINTHHFEWDHKEPSNKTGHVSVMLRRNFKKYKEEIDKCDLLCLFCHADRTKEQLVDKMVFTGRPKKTVSPSVV